jgi:hypothetical protein
MIELATNIPIRIEWAALALLIAMFAAWLFAKARVMEHRCPRVRVVPSIYEAPDALSPALARRLTHGQHDTGALTASLMNLAQAGFISMRRNADQVFAISLRRLNYAVINAAEERSIVKALYAPTRNGTMDLLIGRDQSKHITDLRSKHQQALDERVKNELHMPGRMDGYIFMLLLLLPVFAALLALLKADFELYAYGAALLFLLATASIKQGEEPKPNIPALVIMLLIAGLLGKVTMDHLQIHNVAWASSQVLHAVGMPLLMVALITLAGVLWSLYRDMMKLRPNADFCRLTRQARGLEQFMAQANLDEIRRHRPEQPLPQSFQHLLPYAAAFGILPLWMSTFAHELSQQALINSGADSGSTDASGLDSDGSFGSITDLWSQMDSNFDQSISDALSDASDSSSDSDSDSGGGGGGGD